MTCEEETSSSAFAGHIGDDTTKQAMPEPAADNETGNKTGGNQGPQTRKERVMKRLTKRLIGASMAAMMSLGMASAIPAYAATITVENNDPSTDTNATTETHVAYKIFDAVKATGTTVSTSGAEQTASGPITYKIGTTNPWFSVLFNANGSAKEGNAWFTATAIPGESNTFQVIPAEDYASEAKAKAAAGWLLAHKPSGETGQGLVIGANTVDDGYYLITSSLGANLGLATTDVPMSIVEKNDFPSVDKTQKDAEETSANYADTAVDVQVGDTIDYSVVVWVPESASGQISIADVMSSGLSIGSNPTFAVTASATYDANTKAISEGTALTPTTDYAVTPSETGFSATINATAATKGKFVQIKFSATVTSAAVADTGKKNTVTLTYSNFSQNESVEYDIYAAGMVKYDGKRGTIQPDDGNALPASGVDYLADAEFQLIDKDGTTVVPVSYDAAGGYYYPDANGTATITSVANGTGIVIRGLDNQTYYLKETKAPNGYNLSTSNATLTVANSDSLSGTDVVLATLTDPNIVKIQNNAGSILPITGGIGTTILYVVGGFLIIGSATYLVVRARTSHDDEK